MLCQPCVRRSHTPGQSPTCAITFPTQEVERRKAAAKEADAARSEVSRLKQQLAACRDAASELQRANTELRSQLQQLPDSAATAAAATAGGGSAAAVAVAALRRQVEQLQGALRQREAESVTLRATADQLQQQVQQHQQQGQEQQQQQQQQGQRQPEGQQQPGGQEEEEAAKLQRRLEELEAENAELWGELGVFDSEFWDELEELVSQRASTVKGRGGAPVVFGGGSLGALAPNQTDLGAWPTQSPRNSARVDSRFLMRRPPFAFYPSHMLCSFS
jgi:DNA repair exonuclease SbcCD ATPase subunit